MGTKKLYEMDGRKATLGAYALRYNINEQTLRRRIEYGMTIRQAILASNVLKKNEVAAKVVKGALKAEDPKPEPKEKAPVARRTRWYQVSASSGYYDWE